MKRLRAICSRLLREPLLHFLLLAVPIFWLNGGQGGAAASGKLIQVNRENLQAFVSARLRVLGDESATHLDRLPEEAWRDLVDDYVMQEALYREAVALGLSERDELARRLLVERLNGVLRRLSLPREQPSEEALKTYFEQHHNDYYQQDTIGFSHIFIRGGTLSRDQLIHEAQQLLQKIRLAEAGPDQATFYGDRFLYQTHYADKTQELIASHFGEAMAEQLLALDSQESWLGPFESPYGLHLVYISERHSGRFPTLEEVRGRVEQDWFYATLENNMAELRRNIRSSYRVHAEPEVARHIGAES